MGRSLGVLAFVLTVAARADAVCPGDCNGDGQVTIDEIQRLVVMVLRTVPNPCLAGDVNGDGSATVDELITAVNAALLGCPPEEPTSTATMAPTATAAPTSTAPPPPTATATPALDEFIAAAEDFDDFASWTPVRRYRVTNKLGRLEEAVQIATELGDTPGLMIPVGTILQSIASEAMVKRGGGFDPDHHDWEYFRLRRVGGKTEIVERGGIETSGGSCYNCHARARTFDYICQTTHNCGL